MSKAPSYVRAGKSIIDAIIKLSGRHPTWEVFQDFLAVSAISISNRVDWTQKEEREKQYMEIIKKYSTDEQQQLAKIFGTLIKEMDQMYQTKGIQDILGEVFHGLELHNKYQGQFFTPWHICDMIGKITIDDAVEKEIKKTGYIAACEPCIGAGALILGFANAMRNHNWNPQTQLCVTACDIDLKCVHMAYLQLSLYGIPAVIIHGDFLTSEQWSVWYTPTYMTGLWILREHRNLQDISTAVREKKDASANEQEKVYDFKIEQDGQLCMF